MCYDIKKPIAIKRISYTKYKENDYKKRRSLTCRILNGNRWFFSKGTLHYMKQNAKSDKLFTLNVQMKERRCGLREGC